MSLDQAYDILAGLRGYHLYSVWIRGVEVFEYGLFLHVEFVPNELPRDEDGGEGLLAFDGWLRVDYVWF